MNRYVLKFAKEGYSRFTSHLDMLRLFKRAFKRTEIPLVYSQGFNPHPKLGFAQPLSLGYTSVCELLEFETEKAFCPQEIEESLKAIMPEGIAICGCTFLPDEIKSLASAAEAADYRVVIPVSSEERDYEKILADYLAQPEILAEKRQKKTKKLIQTDIRPKIRSVQIESGSLLTLYMRLDCGSQSNLSPEQVITSFLNFARIPVQRPEITVERRQIIFGNNLQF